MRYILSPISIAIGLVILAKTIYAFEAITDVVELAQIEIYLNAIGIAAIATAVVDFIIRQQKPAVRVRIEALDVADNWFSLDRWGEYEVAFDTQRIAIRIILENHGQIAGKNVFVTLEHSDLEDYFDPAIEEDIYQRRSWALLLSSQEIPWKTPDRSGDLWTWKGGEDFILYPTKVLSKIPDYYNQEIGRFHLEPPSPDTLRYAGCFLLVTAVGENFGIVEGEASIVFADRPED